MDFFHYIIVWLQFQRRKKVSIIIFPSLGHTTFESGDQMTQFNCPTKIWSGKGALDALKTCQAKKVFLVTDSFFVTSGKTAEIEKRMPGAVFQIFDQVRPDPPSDLAAKGAAACRTFRPELLIALGGGSAMDCAKAIRLAAELPMQFLAIPTTSGSGSEVTSFSILTHGDVKYPLIDPILRPDMAILDESLLESLPETLIADTGMDLLAHCVEALAAKNKNTFTDALACSAASIVLSNLQASFSGDRTVRGTIHEAATMAGMAFDQAGLGLCHAVAHVLGGETHLAHGRLCAMVLPHVMQFNSQAVLKQYARLAQICGCGAAADSLSLRNLIASIVRLRSSLHIPATLRALEMELPDRKRLAKLILRDPCCDTNPVPVTECAVLQILEAVAG